VVFGHDLFGEHGELVQHAVRRAEWTQDELGAATFHVFLDLGDHDLGRPEGRARAQGRVVDPPPL
jgi:hypothetical protein